METWPFDYFTLGEDFPDSAFKARFGRSYEFAVEPKGPDQIEFILKIEGMWFFLEADGVTLDLNTQRDRNMGKLREFYKAHGTWKPFLFKHPILDEVTVRFKEPLRWRLVKDGKGLTEPLEIKLVLLP